MTFPVICPNCKAGVHNEKNHYVAGNWVTPPGWACPQQARTFINHPMAATPTPNPHVDIFAYLAHLEARVEAQEAAREVQQALSSETRAGLLLTRLEATLHVLGDMPYAADFNSLTEWRAHLSSWVNKVRAAAQT